MTGKRKYQYGMRDSPQCRVCQHEEQESTRNVSDTTHILGGCPNNRLRSLHNKRHDTAVELIKKAISHGLQGSARLLTDTGKEIAKADRKRQTLPQYLYSVRIKDVRAVKRPDLAMFELDFPGLTCTVSSPSYSGVQVFLCGFPVPVAYFLRSDACGGLS